jgi:hypothetical protein
MNLYTKEIHKMRNSIILMPGRDLVLIMGLLRDKASGSVEVTQP